MNGSPQPVTSPGIRERFPDLYEELRDVASRVLGNTAPPSLAPTELMHEAYLRMHGEELRRLVKGRSELGAKPDWAFKACFGAACRDILADRTRRREAAKRGGGQHHEELHSLIPMGSGRSFDAIAVDDALVALAELDSLLAQLVEARFFGGLTVAECAELFDLSPRTIDRKWDFARAWLEEQL